MIPNEKRIKQFRPL